MVKCNLKNVYKSTFVIIGTIIGAGFASGQEIYLFFNRYGIMGLVGLFLSMSLISMVIYKTFQIILYKKSETYQKFIEKIIPQRLKNKKIIVNIISNIINIFLIISFNIMVAGFASYFLQEIGISKWYGAMIIAILSFIAFSKNINGIVKINEYLIPILIILIAFLGYKKINSFSILEIENNISNINWIKNSILYASYNSITLIPILISLNKYIKNEKEAKLASIFTIIIMLILAVIIFLLMNLFIKDISNIEIPIVYIANTVGKKAKYIYGLTVLIAMFTTAISTGYGFLNNIAKTRKKYLIISIIICVCSIFIGQIKFSNLINVLYPIFGYLGILQIIFLIIA